MITSSSHCTSSFSAGGASIHESSITPSYNVSALQPEIPTPHCVCRIYNPRLRGRRNHHQRHRTSHRRCRRCRSTHESLIWPSMQAVWPSAAQAPTPQRVKSGFIVLSSVTIIIDTITSLISPPPDSVPDSILQCRRHIQGCQRQGRPRRKSPRWTHGLRLDCRRNHHPYRHIHPESP